MPKKVNIKGTIISDDDAWIYEWFGIDATSPRSVQKQLDAAGSEDIDVMINSGGGSVFAGSEIYTAIKEYTGKSTGKIVGLAASAASVIAMGVDNLMMSPTAQMMIHNASAIGAGDYRDMEHTAGILKNVNETIANAYAIKSGMSHEELLEMMDNETWMTSKQAKEYGLIDEIMFSESQVPVFSASTTGCLTLPEEVINKIRNMKDQLQPTGPGDPPQNNQPAICAQQKLQAQLKLLKLRGATPNE